MSHAAVLPSADVAVSAAVTASLNFLNARTPRPVSYAYEPPLGAPVGFSGIKDVRSVEIRNARLLAEEEGLGLDSSGFELISQPTAAIDFSDPVQIRTVYYPEAQALIRRITGAREVLIFDHTLRDSAQGSRHSSLREPARRVHNDQTFKSGPRRLLDHLPPDVALDKLRGRFAIVNLWRPIGVPVEQAPLALCDARSIDEADLVPCDLVYRDKIGETYGFVHNPRQRWYYYPQVRPDEALLLKIYDSQTRGVSRLTAHTAFDDPTSPADAAPRRSIELRTLVFFERSRKAMPDAGPARQHPWR